MGDVVDFKPKPPTVEKLEFNQFCDEYEKRIDVVNSLTNFLLLNAAKELDIGKINEYDVFMLRESIMSLIMRSKCIHHPLQDFTEEYADFFSK